MTGARHTLGATTRNRVKNSLVAARLALRGIKSYGGVQVPGGYYHLVRVVNPLHGSEHLHGSVHLHGSGI